MYKLNYLCLKQSRIIYKLTKSVNGEHFVICEGGTHHLLRPALVKESFPVKALIQNSENFRKTHVHGPLCTSLDQLGIFQLPDNLKSGDLIAFGQCGAYGFTESMPFFLCHDLPGEIILRDGEYKIIRKVETAKTWLR